MGRVKTVAFTHTANLIRYNSCDRGVRHACDKDYGERKMAKTTPKAKNSAFMKPMEPSEHLAKVINPSHHFWAGVLANVGEFDDSFHFRQGQANPLRLQDEVNVLEGLRSKD